jgi:VanZ family protein
MEKQLRKKKAATLAGLVLLVLVYFMIFSFSAEDADASSAVSVRVTRFLMQLYGKLFYGGEAAKDAVAAGVDETEAVIRKLAHFSEYFLVGFLSFGMLKLWMANTGKAVRLVFLQLVLSAALDEFHQYFVPGRYASVKDVMIDTAGGMAGLFLVLCIIKLKKHRTKLCRV